MTMTPPPRLEPSPRRVRVEVGGVLAAESLAPRLLCWYGPGRLPTYLFDDDELSPAAEAVAVRASSLGPAPEDGWTFPWDDPRVAWFEEAEQVHVHARDTSKRVDVVASDRHVRIEHDGVLLADSRRPRALFESPLPPRWYLPREDVRLDLLDEVDAVTRCPYKGTARWWAHGGRDLAWSYEQPVPECPRIAGLIAFFDEHVDVELDGERRPRPVTPWS